MSTLTTPQEVLAIVQIPDAVMHKLPQDAFTLVLDNIQDPGNLGTIVRTADWFGFKQLICSYDTVDVYNPKVVQASMGSLARMQISYVDLPSLLKNCSLPVYGALLNGVSINETDFPKAGVLILGNEGNGIRDVVQKYIQHAVTIPRYGGAESLNVAISAGIFCMGIKKSLNN